MAKIMIVDDDPDVRKLVEMTLKISGAYETIVCSGGGAALGLIEKEKPDLILLDITMPDIDGYEVCKQIKSSPETKYVSIIFLSSNRDIDDKVKGMDMGADDYIVKPFNQDELMSRVRAQLRIRELEKELIDKEKLETLLAMAVTLSHEINNPLTALLGNAQILKDWSPGDETDVNECAEVIIKEGKGIADLIKKISKIKQVVETPYIGKTKMIDVEASTIQP